MSGYALHIMHLSTRKNSYIHKIMKPLSRYASPEYMAWQSMHSRCLNERDPGYPHYGGRGIGVCKSWSIYENFLLDMGRKPSPHLSLDRINNDKGYSPENCRWATPKQQRNNQRKRGPHKPKPPLKGTKRTMAIAIRKARERLNENQTQFATRFGLNQATISRWEETGPPTEGYKKKMIDMLLEDIDRVLGARSAE
jgi:DNA-binding transcriptional regulator YiaG